MVLHFKLVGISVFIIFFYICYFECIGITFKKKKTSIFENIYIKLITYASVYLRNKYIVLSFPIMFFISIIIFGHFQIFIMETNTHLL